VRRLFLYFLVLGLVGCATPYQSFELLGRGGYQEKRVGEDVYQVTYYGNHLTSMETINSLLLYRCAELTVNSGYRNFEVMTGYARMPTSSLGGFRIAEHTIKMSNNMPEEQRANTYLARKVIEQYGPQVGQQK
jgi:hypothetical protein